MSPIPINSSMGMFISLAVAFIVTPWLAGRGFDEGRRATARWPGHTAGQLDAPRSLFRRIMTPLLDPQPAPGAGQTWFGVVLAIALSVSLAVVQLVVLKMLPFDNKSEFQVVLDMPVGTPVETTAEVLREIGDELAKVPEVTDFQTYAGTAAPINFNGLVRQYYLRSAARQGDLQVNLVDQTTAAARATPSRRCAMVAAIAAGMAAM